MIILIGLLLALCVGVLVWVADGVWAGFARRTVIEGRLALVTPIADAPSAPDARPGVQKGFGPTFRLMRRLFALDVSRRWGVKTSPLTLVLSSLLCGASMWLLAHAVIGSPTWLSLLLTAAAAAAGPRILLGGEKRKMEALFLERFPNAVDMLVRALRAGIPLTAAISAVASEAPPPVASVFAGLAAQTEIGVPLDEALAKAAVWIKLPDFRFFAVAVALQYATGGNLAATLDTLSEIVRKRRLARLKAKAVSAEVRLSTYILSALPLLVMGAMLVVSPGYLKPLLTDPRGHWILGVAIGGLLSGLAVMRSMMNSILSD